MLMVWRIIAGIACVAFNFYVGENKNKPTLGKQVTEEEYKYVDFLRVYTYISSWIIVYLITGIE